jgi:hypothetical protein
MKFRNTLLITLLFLPVVSMAQQRVWSSTNTQIIVNDIPAAEKKIDGLIERHHLKPAKYSKSRYLIELQVYADQALYDSIISAYKDWGYISSENTTMTSYARETERLMAEIASYEQQRNAYLSLADYADSTKTGSYLAYREKALELDKLIMSDRTRLSEYSKGENVNYVGITVSEEYNSTMDYESSWVNMPGIEYSHLWVEQPKDGVTPQAMHGVSLKYMFNTGKSYGILGLYKNYGAATQINEAYLFAFGQDFYSRRMGRGQRKFLNLYTSLNAGVYVLSGEGQRSASWFINPFLGVEIFKNKYFLIDNKVGYFLPYRDNRDMRGLLYNVSFNFVF